MKKNKLAFKLIDMGLKAETLKEEIYHHHLKGIR